MEHGSKRTSHWHTGLPADPFALQLRSRNIIIFSLAEADTCAPHTVIHLHSKRADVT